MIEPIQFGEMESLDREATLSFVKMAQALAQKVSKAQEKMSEANADLTQLIAEIKADPSADQNQLAALRKLQLELMDIGEIFSGDPTRSRRNESALPGLSSRLRTMMFGAMGSSEGPTQTHRSQYAIVEKQLADAEKKLSVAAARVSMAVRQRESKKD